MGTDEMRLVESVIREFDCPTCGAVRGQPCTTTGDRPASIAHTRRFELAVAAGRLPLSSDERRAGRREV